MRSLEVQGNQIVLVRIPRSWVSPHMVTHKGTSRFFARNSAGKYQLDVSELRTAFGGWVNRCVNVSGGLPLLV